MPTLPELIQQHIFDDPPDPLRKLVAELEKTIDMALQRAAEAAALHGPFVDAASIPPGTAETSEGPPNVLRVLDVGYVRVDGRGLWPDEASELQLWPHFAPLSLSEMVAPPRKLGGKKLWKAGVARTHGLSSLKHGLHLQPSPN